ncbi:MAG: GldG family protein [Candidatus Sericytochromatia bacterium]|nr:GldG family protein [Candidatus Sericytochromatia bacterium]
MSDPELNPQDSRLAAVDKANLVAGLLAIALLAGSLLVTNVAGLAAKLPQGASEYMRLGGFAMMGLYVLTLVMLKEREVSSVLKHKNTGSFFNITLQIAAVIGILSAVNYFGTRHHARVDLTENKQYSLSEQSIKVAKDLKEPVSVMLFIRRSDTYAQNLETLWKQYAYVSDKVKLEVVDVDQNPTLTRQNKITTSGSSILKRGAQSTTITGNQEQDLTSALIKITRDSQKTIYFTVGHGELAYDKFDKDGISQLKDYLEKQSYKLDQLSLFVSGKVPSDAALVIVPAPTKPLSDKEMDALEAYIKDGGKVFVAANPQAETNVDKLTKRFGIAIKDDLILDPKSNLYGSLDVPVVTRFPYHVTTQNLQAAYFPGSRSLQKMDKQPEGVTNISPLVETSDSAWGETDLKARPVQYDQGKDTKGPIALMMVSEMGAKGKLMVAGNGSFFSNAAFGNLNNGDLFLSAVNWMTGEDSLVSIPPKEASNKQLNLTPAQYTAIFYGAVLGFPFTLLLLALFTWWRRR